MFRWLLCTCAFLMSGCVGGVSDLVPNSTPDGSVRGDGGLLDGGIAADAGAPINDLGVADARADAGTDAAADAGLDAGAVPRCPSGWTTVATTGAMRGLRTESFAPRDDGFALTWSEFDENWTEQSFLQFFDIEAQPLGTPIVVTPGSRVVTNDGRYYVGGQGGLQIFDSAGILQDTLQYGPFFPHTVIGGVIHGVILRDASGPVPARLDLATSMQLQVVPISVGLAPRYVFGPSSFVVVDPAMTGATLRLFDPTGLLVEFEMAAETGSGRMWRPTDLSAGVYNPDQDQFELLFAMNAENGRFFGAKVFSFDGTLSAGPSLPNQLSEVTHASLEGDVAWFNGALVAAYNDDFTELSTQLTVTSASRTRRFDVGERLQSRPLLGQLGGKLAFISALHTGAGYWESEIRLHCDP